MIEELTYSHGVASLKTTKVDFQFAIDGIVYYNENFAYKYDYLNSEITTVRAINWAETDKEGFFATISVDPVEIDGATVYNPSSNGTPNMIRMGIGIGSRVEVIRSGVTIPKIINCINPMPINFPKCPHCGYQMSEDDIYGSTLKCGNPKCDGRLENRRDWIKNWINGLDKGLDEARKWMIENPEEGLFWLLNISRFDYTSKRIFSEDACKENLINLYTDFNYLDEKDLLDYLGKAYSFTDLQWSECELNIWSTFESIKELMLTNTYEAIRNN
jgi:hypothetical protein